MPCIVTRLIIDRKLQCYIIEATDIYFYKKENKRQHEKIKDWYMYIKYFIEGHTCVPSRTHNNTQAHFLAGTSSYDISSRTHIGTLV